jgi:hypothetical protein
MADKKISELTELTTPDGAEELVVNDSGVSKKITQTNLLSTALPLAGGTMTGTIAGFTSTGIDDNATSTAITIDASENVGIGGNLVVGAGNGAEPLLQFTNSGRLPGSPGFSFRDDLDTGMYQPVSTVGTICFSANGTEMARINGNGLSFNGDTAAANALDDYEEGTWNLTNVTAGSTTGSYTKIGDTVTVTYDSDATFSSATTALPFSSVYGVGVSFYADGIVMGAGIVPNVLVAGSTMYFRTLNQATGAYGTFTDLSGTFRISATYHTN